MFKLLKGGECYTPKYIGKKDVLIIDKKIYKISDKIDERSMPDLEIIDCSGKLICPGLIDQHLHITGGGGEEGPESCIPEITIRDIVNAGITTVVGVLGFNDLFRNISTLLAKAKALEEEGLTTYIYTGSYSLPTATLTGKVETDIAFIDKVIGAGEIAISDYRSSYPSIEELKKLASEVKKGAMLGKKAGVLHINLGDGKQGLEPVLQLIEESDFPINMFVPTHVNRNRKLFKQAVEHNARGGQIDLTAGENSGKGYSVPDAMEILINSKAKMDKVTVSSDANGSMPSPDGKSTVAGKVTDFFYDIRQAVLAKNISIETALSTVTENVAKLLKLYPYKGAVLPGSDADILILNKENFSIDTVIAMGTFMVKEGFVIKKGRFEK